MVRGGGCVDSKGVTVGAWMAVMSASDYQMPTLSRFSLLMRSSSESSPNRRPT